MSLYVNSPSYYSQIYGIDEDVYKKCRSIEKNIDIKNYTSKLDTVGITPIIAPDAEADSEEWKELKYISLSYRMASISLRTDFSSYISSNPEEKKALIIKNILSSLFLIKKRLKDDFDYERIEKDILACDPQNRYLFDK